MRIKLIKRRKDWWEVVIDILSFLQSVFDANLISLQVLCQHDLFFETLALFEVLFQLL